MKTLEDMTRTTAALIPFQKSRDVVRFFKYCITNGKVDYNNKEQFRKTFNSSVKQINRKWTRSNWRISDESEIEDALFENAWELLTSKDSLLSRLISDVSTWNEFVSSPGNDQSRQISVDNVATHINCINTTDVSESCNTILQMKETTSENHFVLVPLEQVMFACILVGSMTKATTGAKDLIISKYIVEGELDFSDKFALAAICKSPYVLNCLWHEDRGEKTTGLCHELALYMVQKVGSEGSELIQWLSDRFVQVEHKNSDEDTLLHIAAKLGNLPLVESLLSKGADVNMVNNDWKTPLHKAVEGGSAKIVQLLLDRRAEIERKSESGSTPLHKAAENDNTEVVELLLDRGAQIDNVNKFGNTPLHIAANRRTMKTMNALLKRSAQIEIKNNLGDTPLMTAVKANNHEAVQVLLDLGANVKTENEKGTQILHIFAQKGNIEIMERLIVMGADVNKQRNTGETPLHFACRNGQIESVKMLLDADGDAALTDQKGRTALHEAAWNSHHEIVEILLPKLSVPCINTQDHNGKTALHLAAEFNKDKNVVSALLKKGADTKIKSKDGKTASDFAACNKHTEILNEFLKMN